jgi:hypothetical protein
VILLTIINNVEFEAYSDFERFKHREQLLATLVDQKKRAVSNRTQHRITAVITEVFFVLFRTGLKFKQISLWIMDDTKKMYGNMFPAASLIGHR